jgi:hypothetical protein
VPVPAPAAQVSNLPPGHPETPTVELGPEYQAALAQWARKHGAGDSSASPEDDTPTSIRRPSDLTQSNRAEAGLRICPTCKQPVHLGADACRTCGTPVPRR